MTTLLPGVAVARAGRLSVPVPVRATVVAALLALCVVAALVGGLAVGELPTAVPDVVAALAGADQGAAAFVVTELRLPRALVGMVAGTGLATAGALFQTVGRNPLATPDLLGVTTGAGVAAVAVALFVPASGVLGLQLGALAGGVGVAVAVGLLAWRGGLALPRVLLVGVAFHFAAVSLTALLLAVADVRDAAQALVWLSGSLNGREPAQAWPALAVLAVVLVTAPAARRALRLLALGEDSARGLGLRLTRARLLLLGSGVALAATATAAAGPIGFVALSAPQIARRLARTGEPPLVSTALTGALTVLLADLAGRTLLAPTEVPVGLVTAAVGGPYLLWLLTREGRR